MAKVWSVGDGWEPLCEFLELPVPDTPFPHLHDTNDFRAACGLPPLPVLTSGYVHAGAVKALAMLGVGRRSVVARESSWPVWCLS